MGMRLIDDSAHMDDGMDYCGPATLVIEGEEFETRVRLRGFFQPIDGTYRWHGRTDSGTSSLARFGRDRASGAIRTAHGQAAVIIDEIDLWGRYRLRGSGRPPFPPAGLPHDRD
ncbi:putative flavin binding monooxygenase [Mycobacteroides abscessus 4S-0726-RB]|nr:putative flavin binding monooxygenase [Mycobacteroides abscessus 4S-0726-RB]EIV54789.1 putative flavin binding monooxygenase [Mycobacteroides abscessus 4S-0116-R]EIV61066.1 putative flavin binding monooxygenase [Mycobacteroides abscessus 4S-0116-S]EUA48087.1 putative flavin binding monooxygenase [Mycobacteroides abscessus 21]